MDTGRVSLNELDLKKFTGFPTIVIIAKRGSGKSWITRDILYRYRHTPAGIIIAPTDNNNPFYSTFFKDIYIHYEFKPDILKKAIFRQTIMIEKSVNKEKIGKKVDPSIILIMDDCLAESKQWKNSDEMRIILMNGRHYRIIFVLTMQEPMGVPPAFRGNFDYVFLLTVNSFNEKKKIYDNYASIFRTLPEFEQAFDKCTDNFGAMVINNKAVGKNISDKVFWFKAKDRNFEFGCKNFRTFHNKYYDPNFFFNTNLRKIGKNRVSKKNEADVKIDLMKL